MGNSDIAQVCASLRPRPERNGQVIELSEFNQDMLENFLHGYVSWTRYLLVLIMAVYTCFNFRYFFVDEPGKKKICERQIRLMVLLQLIAYSVIWMNTRKPAVAVFYVLQTVFFLCFIYGYRAVYPKASRLLLNNMCMLLGVGLIMLTRLNFDRAVRQFIIAAASALVCLLVPVIINRVRFLRKLAWLYAGTGILLLGAVWIAGTTSFGAQLSLSIGDFTVQPSEFVKILYVCFIAAMLSRSTDSKNLILTSAVAALHVLILVLSKDLGSALIFFLTYLFLLYAATSDLKWLGAGLLSGGLAAAAAYRFFSHVQRRVLAWRDPWSDIDDRGYQIAQSLFAIGTGSWFGLGLYEGMPWKIPVVEKDFIFAAISEEMGALFALCVLLICLGCFFQFVQIARQMRDLFYQLTAFGLGTVYLVQVFLTVGGVIKFIPSTGVTLPLVSYGGSSLMSTFLLFGVIQGLHAMAQPEQKQESEEEPLTSPHMQNIPDAPSEPNDVGRNMLRLTCLAMAFFAWMILYEGWFLTVRREETINNSYNARLDSIAERVVREKIVSGDDGTDLTVLCGSAVRASSLCESGDGAAAAPIAWKIFDTYFSRSLAIGGGMRYTNLSLTNTPTVRSSVPDRRDCNDRSNELWRCGDISW